MLMPRAELDDLIFATPTTTFTNEELGKTEVRQLAQGLCGARVEHGCEPGPFGSRALTVTSVSL